MESSAVEEECGALEAKEGEVAKVSDVTGHLM